MRTSDIDNVLTAWVGEREDARIRAVLPGAGIDELAAMLRGAEERLWTSLCICHVVDRAAELCAVHKDGDLYYRNGDYFWTMFSPEIDNALKKLGCRRRKDYLAAAREAFVNEIDFIRERRLGPPELRHVRVGAYESTLTFGDFVRGRSRRGVS
jgi:hypothetical protein